MTQGDVIQVTQPKPAALPGALLLFAGAWLIIWALREWGLFGGNAQ